VLQVELAQITSL